MLKVLLQTWGTGQMASAYSSQIAPPADADVSDTAAKSDDDDANKVDRRDAQTQARHDVHQLEAEEWCAQIVYDVTALMKHQNNSSDDERARAARLHATSGVIAATDMSQIIADEPLTSFPASREGGQVMDVFRALIIGSVGGLNDETLAHVVSVMVQLSAAPFPFEITYLNPDGPTLAAARDLVADGCSDELIRGTHDTLRFVEATLVDFLDTADTDGENVQKFDYVDVGGPLASPPSNDSDQEDSSMNIDTLLLLGEKLLKRGAYLRVWSFAASPEGDLLFHARDAYAATSSMLESAAGDPRNLSRRILAHQTLAEVTLAQVLRNRFGLGWEQTDGNDSDESLANERNGSRTMTASGGETIGQQKTVIPTTAAQRRAAQDEQTWVKQVLTARRDERMLTVSDIDAVLSRAGFKTTQLLGDVKRYERGGAGDEGWNFSGVDDILEGMSRWEAAALADSLAPQPVLVHQVLAVWQDDLDSL